MSPLPIQHVIPEHLTTHGSKNMEYQGVLYCIFSKIFEEVKRDP